MIGALTSPLALLALVAGVLFAALCWSDLRRAVWVFVVVGCLPVPLIVIGRNLYVTQGLLLVEVLATVLIVVWAFTRVFGDVRRAVGSPFMVPLVLLVPLGLLSLVSGFTYPDPEVDASHLRLSMSIGQLLLFVWPVGTALVVADVATPDWIRRIWRTIIVLGTPAILVPLLPRDISLYLGWTQYFALVGSPLAMAALVRPGRLLPRPVLLLVAVSPLVVGLLAGRAFFYGYFGVALATVALVGVRKTLLLALPVLAGVYLLGTASLSIDVVPEVFDRLVQDEQQQQSLGGRFGRVALAKDALTIWQDRPWLGVGPANNYPYMLRYSVLGTAHNQYLELLLELGIGGFVCLVAFILLAVRFGLQLRRQTTDGFHETVVTGWLGMFAGFVVGGLVGDFMLQSIRNGGLETFAQFYLQWVVLGLVLAIGRVEGEPMDEPEEEEEEAADWGEVEYGSWSDEAEDEALEVQRLGSGVS